MQEFYTYKLKEKRRYKIMLKHMHYSINTSELKTEIEELGHTVTNIWNITHFRTKLPLPIFIVDLKPTANNKEIFNVGYLRQGKIKFEQPKHKRGNAQYAKCQSYGHTKNFCYLKPRCIKCTGNHSTDQRHQKERSSDN
jgi:hypothetical protein